MANLNEYSNLQYLETKDSRIAYFIIKNHLSKKYLIWINSSTKCINTVYSMLLNLSNTFQINVILFDYPGQGNSEGIFTEKNCYNSLKIIMKNVKDITKNSRILPDDIVLCGNNFGALLVKKYIKHHKYEKYILIDLPKSEKLEINKKRKLTLIDVDFKINKNKVTYYQDNLLRDLEGFILVEKYQNTF